MISKKYSKEYRLEPERDSHGNIVENSVYIGPLYCLELSRNDKRNIYSQLIISIILSILFYVSGLWNECEYAHKIYILIPAICQGILIYHYITILIHFISADERLDREHKEKTVDRMKSCGMVGSVVGGLSLTGMLFYSISNIFVPHKWDVYFIICVLVQTTIPLLLYLKGRKVVVTEVENPNT